MRRLLITGFEPFGGDAVNSSWEVCKAMPDTIRDWKVYRMQIPVAFGRGADEAIHDVRPIDPCAVICLGQAAGRTAVTPEMFALNLRYAEKPDADGCIPHDQPCLAEGPLALKTTLEIREMTAAIREAGIPAQVSYSAGTYVCNDLYYRMLWNFRGSPFRVIFIHLPLLPEQTAKGCPGEGLPSLTLEQMVKAVTAAVEAID